MKIYNIYKEVLSEDFKSQTVNYIKQGIEPEIVKSYIEKFKHIRDKKYRELFDPKLEIDVAPEKRNNIDAYKDFHDLEQVVDYVAGKRQGISTLGSGKEDIEVDAKPIYEDDDFVVYYADTPRACIKYKGKFPYSWCIARADSSNMFYTYRFKPYEPAFYFIKNKKLTEKEFGIWNMTKNVFQGKFKYPYHFFVLQVPKNVDKENDENEQYIVSSANNDGDKQMSWQQILKISPRLKSIKEVLEPKPFTPEEREKNNRFKNGISDKEFAKLSYEDKRNYLDIYPTIAKPISDNQLTELPDDLLNLYVSFGIGLSDKQFEYIKPKKDILKRYTQISKRKFEEYISKADKWERRQLKMTFTELIVLSDEEIKQYLDTLNDQEINAFVREYGEDKLEMLEKHVPHKFNVEHKTVKVLVKKANDGDKEALAKIQSMLPEQVNVRFYNDYIIFDTLSYGRLLKKKMDSEMFGLFEYLDYNSWSSYGDDYFDGDEEGLKSAYDSAIEEYVKQNQDKKHDFSSVDLTFNAETVKDLLESYDEKDNVESDIRQVYTDAKQKGEDEKFDEIKAEIREIAFIDDDTDANIKIGPFIMFIAKLGPKPDQEISADGKTLYDKKTGERYHVSEDDRSFFTTDPETFIENLANLMNGILESQGSYRSNDEIWEEINEAGYNVPINHQEINDSIESAIDDAFDKFIADEDDDTEGEDGEKKNMAKLKSQIINSLNTTLKKLNQAPDATHIENDIVRIDIDRQRFHLDGKVYVKITDKKTGESHEGYVPISEIPNYFLNYKLFEQVKRMKVLMKR